MVEGLSGQSKQGIHRAGPGSPAVVLEDDYSGVQPHTTQWSVLNRHAIRWLRGAAFYRSHPLPSNNPPTPTPTLALHGSPPPPLLQQPSAQARQSLKAFGAATNDQHLTGYIPLTTCYWLDIKRPVFSARCGRWRRRVLDRGAMGVW